MPPRDDSKPMGDIRQQREQAYHRLRPLLILQQIPSGARLREADWASRLKVNRTALREAFARLEAEGLIEKGPKTGYVVPVLTERDLQEIIEVRLLLEGGAIERIGRLRLNTSRNLRRMREACEHFERLARGDYLLGAAEADRRFHEALVEAADNQRMAMLYQRAPLPIVRPEIVTGEQWVARLKQSFEEHRAILKHLLKGEISAAQQTLRVHLRERSWIPLSPL